MTIEEAIQYFENRLESVTMSASREAFALAISVLRVKQSTEDIKSELREIVQKFESCGYECEAGPLTMNQDFVRLKEMAI